MHADKIGAKKEKQPFLEKSSSFGLRLLFSLKFTEGHLIADRQKIYPWSKVKTDTKNHEKSHFNLTTGQFLFQNTRQSKDCIFWIMCVGSLTKEAWFPKKLFKIDISLFSFQQLDLNRYDLWKMRFGSRTLTEFAKSLTRMTSTLLDTPWKADHLGAIQWILRRKTNSIQII